MKMPVSPPSFSELLPRIGAKRLPEVLRLTAGPASDGKYRHWDTLRHIEPPAGLSTDEWWLGTKMARLALYVPLPMESKNGEPFRFAPVDLMQEMLMRVDRGASGHIQVSEQVTDPQTRDTYLLKGLIEEAITSSQLEGASTTREVAKDMIQRGRPPRTHDERMIYNNYQALQFIRRMVDSPLTPSMIFEFHRILTEGTLEDDNAAGRFRTPSEAICVMDEADNVLHMPPHADELAGRMQSLCDFANGKLDGRTFLHPVVRAICLHFWLAYDHPFVDGNGRTARALFYWSMASQGYWLCEFISISRILRKMPGRYARSFLYTETDDNDLTYFLLAQLNVTLRAIADLVEYLEVRQRDLRHVQELLDRSPNIRAKLNFRQLALLRHAMKRPNFVYTIESHKNSHNVSYGTARNDLLKLVEVGLFDQRAGPGRLLLFVSPSDIQRRVQRVA